MEASEKIFFLQLITKGFILLAAIVIVFAVTVHLDIKTKKKEDRFVKDMKEKYPHLSEDFFRSLYNNKKL